MWYFILLTFIALILYLCIDKQNIYYAIFVMSERIYNCFSNLDCFIQLKLINENQN
jgi:hypothetical protein